MEEYLKVLLEQIRCKKACPYIQQELQEHIQEQMEENIKSGMSDRQAEEEAVKDMGDPVEVGISLDLVHRPQIAWQLLLMVSLLSIIGIGIHGWISLHMDGTEAYISGKYFGQAIVGIAVMIFLYLVDYTVLAKYSREMALVLILICIGSMFWGVSINGRSYLHFWGSISISLDALMLLYAPFYGGILYQYRGSGKKGIMKAIVWMLVPVFLLLRVPATMGTITLLGSMLMMLTIAVCKDWYTVQKKKTVVILWGTFILLPAFIFAGMYFGNILHAYQKERLHAFVTNSGDANYLTMTLRSILGYNQIIGSSQTDIPGRLPQFNTDYILMYLASTYGWLAAVLVSGILAALIVSVFEMVRKQKNQLGMVMGCGCGMIFGISFAMNVLENIGAFPPTSTFLPFLSAGGSNLIVSYGLMGIVLSIYRYKNIYPKHVSIKKPHIKVTLE